MIDTSFWKAGEIQSSFLANIDKASCDETKAVFLCLTQKKKSQIRLNLRLLAEMVGILPRAKQQPAGLIAHPHHLGHKKGTSLSRYLLLAEMVGFSRGLSNSPQG